MMLKSQGSNIDGRYLGKSPNFVPGSNVVTLQPTEGKTLCSGVAQGHGGGYALRERNLNNFRTFSMQTLLTPSVVTLRYMLLISFGIGILLTLPKL